MNHVPARGRIVGALALFGVLVAVAPAHAQEKWQADLVISTGPGGSLLNFPNEFVENPVTDELLVVDTYNNRILRYAATTTSSRNAGAYLGVIVGSNTAFNLPYGVAVDARGNIVVADTWNHLIRLLSSDGTTELKQVDLVALTGQTVSQPYRISLAPGTILDPLAQATGTVYVIDGGGNQVVVLDSVFNVVRRFLGQFDAPTGLAIDAQFRIYISDPNNNRVQVFEDPLLLPPTQNPAVVASLCGYGFPCTVDTTLASPFGLAIDANGRLLVADAGNNRLAVFSSFADGLQSLNVGIGVATTGIINGPVGCNPFDTLNVCLPDYNPTGFTLPDDRYLADLQGPTNIRLDHKGHLLVADSSNMRVQRFVQPPLTLSTAVAGGTFTTGATIAVTVVASTTEPAGLTGVTPDAVPLAFTGASCGAGSDPALLTTTTPQSYQVGTGQVTYPPAPAPTVDLFPGAPVSFTMTFTAASGSGPLVFKAGATGQNVADGTTTSPQRTLDAISINPSGDAPSTTVTSTPSLPDGTGTLLTGAGALGWFVGNADPVIHLTGNASTTRIDWSTDDQTAAHLEPSLFQFKCGSSTDVVITREGQTLIWYRSWNAAGQNEGWQKVTAYRSLGSAVDLIFASANLNNWYNSPVAVVWTASDAVAGLKKVDWIASGGVSGSTSSLSTSSFAIPGEGTGLTATVTATSNSGRSSTNTATFNIDSTAPVVSSSPQINVSGTSTPASANAALWYKTDLDVVFSATDNLSGFPASDVPAGALNNRTGQKTATVNGDGNSLNASVTFKDLADNSSTASVTGLKIDTTKPTFIVGAPVNSATGASFGGQNGWLDLSSVLGTVGVTLSVTASDLIPVSGLPGSGVKTVCYNLTAGPSCTPAVLTGGVYSVTVYAAGITNGSIWVIDNADNQTAAVPFSLKINRFAPVFTAGTSRTTTENTQLVATTVTATDGDGDALTYTFPAATANGGTLTNVNTATGAYTYTPALNFNGADTFTVLVTDGKSATPTSATVTITVRNANLPPVAVNDAYTTQWNTVLTVPAKGVLLNDTDPNNDPLTAIKVTDTAHGTVTLNGNGNLTYKPTANYSGLDSFTYKARDGALDSNVATVKITITSPCRGDDDDRDGGAHRHRDGDGDDHDRGRNGHHDGDRCEHDREAHDRDHDDRDKVDWDDCRPGTPASHSDTYQTSKNKALTVAAKGVLKNDGPYAVTAEIYTAPLHGTVMLAANGGLVYTPVQNFVGTDVFYYVPRSANGVAGAVTSVTIQVSAHFDGDGDDHDRKRNGHRDGDGCEHDRSRRGDDDRDGGDRRGGERG